MTPQMAHVGTRHDHLSRQQAHHLDRWRETVKQYSQPFDFGDAESVDVAVTVLGFAASATELCIGLDLTNDDENWTEDVMYCEIFDIGYYALPAIHIAAKRGRLRYEFSTNTVGFVNLTAEVNPVLL